MVKGICLLAISIDRLGRLVTGLVGMLNEVSAAVETEYFLCITPSEFQLFTHKAGFAIRGMETAIRLLVLYNSERGHNLC